MLKILTEAFGVSGFEKEVRELILDEIKTCSAKITVDAMGNIKAFKECKNPNAKTVALFAHIDEVGLIVTDITDDGYLKFASVGGIDPKSLIAQRVTVNGHNGVISVKAVHLTDKEERKRELDEKNLYIDIGANSKAEAQKIAQRGDYCGFYSDYAEFGDMVKAKALDDRLGCAIMLDILKKEWDVKLYCIFTVQEEVGLRGARVAAKGLKPDYALVIEGTTCNDLAGVPQKLRVTKCGGGAAISVMDSASRADDDMVKTLVETAKNNNIPYQLKASTAGGNDAGAVSLTDGGIRTASVSVPCKYIHSPVSVMNKRDFEACERLVEGFLSAIGKEVKE